jgi:hypothetical protein
MSSIEERLAGETTAIPWIPDPAKAAKYGKDFNGDNPLIGIAVNHFRRANFRNDGEYDVLVLRLADNSEVAVHCQATVLSNEVRGARPRAGEKVGIKYLGMIQGANQEYAAYKVEVEREEGGEFNWGASSDGGFEEPRQRPEPQQQAAPQDTERPPAPTDDDIPF